MIGTQKHFLSLSFFFLFSVSVLLCGCSGGVQKGEEFKVAGRWDRSIIDKVEKANAVVVIGQSSHLDFTWVYTRDEYWEKFVRRIFDETLDFVLSHPLNKSFFAEVYWLKRYYDELSDERKKTLLELLKSNLIEVVGGGWGTDDFLVVPREAIVRTYISGKRWLEENGLKLPSSAWIPDSFGFPAELPDLLYMLGFSSVAISRVNGFTHPTSYYVFKEIDEEDFVENSGGHLLFKTGTPARWKGVYKDVILWFMPYLYGHGSKLFCVEDIPVSIYLNEEGGCLGDEADEKIFSEKLGKEINKMKRYVRGKFFFIPVGWDFERPFNNLGKFSEWWNENIYPQTGTYVLTGSFSDFAELLMFFGEHDRMEEIQVELSPYWTGYFGSRIYLKRFLYDTAFSLMSLETLNAMLWYFTGMSRQKDIDEVWKLVHFLSNHDSGAGTLYRVPEKKDIITLLDEISRMIKKLINEIGDEFVSKVGLLKDEIIVINPVGFPRWIGDFKVNPAGFLKIKLSDENLSRLPKIVREQLQKSVYFFVYDSGSESQSLSFPFYLSSGNYKISFSLSLWIDEGGAWRLGNETGNCKFQEEGEFQGSYTLSISKFTWNWDVMRKRETNRLSEIIDLTIHSLPQYRTAVLKVVFPEIITISVEGLLGLKSYQDKNLVYSPTFVPFQTFFIVYTRTGKKFLFSVKGAKGVARFGENSLYLLVGRNTPFEKCDVLGPIPTEKWGDMGEDGPFRTTFVFAEIYDDYDGFFESYSFFFPFIILRGKSSSENQILQNDFSLVLPNPVLSLRIDEKDNSFITTSFFPMRNINPGGKYSHTYPINPRTGEGIGFSAYFKMFLQSPPNFTCCVVF